MGCLGGGGDAPTLGVGSRRRVLRRPCACDIPSSCLRTPRPSNGPGGPAALESCHTQRLLCDNTVLCQRRFGRLRNGAVGCRCTGVHRPNARTGGADAPLPGPLHYIDASPAPFLAGVRIHVHLCDRRQRGSTARP